eukprot:7389995-Pyramimonas_sp.AAC.1
MHIYTDGSGGSAVPSLTGPPSWSFVVFGELAAGQLACLGYLAQPVPSLQDIFVQPSTAAEFEGGLWACLWVLSQPWHMH